VKPETLQNIRERMIDIPAQFKLKLSGDKEKGGGLVAALQSSTDLDLRLLSVRIDFNFTYSREKRKKGGKD
jgi:hypothetical protein